MYKNTVSEAHDDDVLLLKVGTPETMDALEKETAELALKGVRQMIFKSVEALNLWVDRKASIVRLRL